MTTYQVAKVRRLGPGEDLDGAYGAGLRVAPVLLVVSTRGVLFREVRHGKKKARP